MKTYEYLGITDEETNCSCCGRVDLKATIALKEIATGNIVYFGRTCGARAIGWTVKVMDAAIATSKKAQQEQAEAARMAREYAIQNHPMMVALNAEIESFWSQSPRPAFADAPRTRWANIRKEVESLVGA